jgi:hypothetical protein
VKLRLVDDKIVTDPMPVRARQGDTLAWTSDEGEVTVSFDASPFDGDRHFAGHKGRQTPIARVRGDAQPGHFDCTATINGKGGSKVYGVDIVP